MEIINRKPIKITPYIKNIFLTAKHETHPNTSQWIIFVNKVEVDGYSETPIIKRYASLDVSSGFICVDTTPKTWGNILGYNFFPSTKEEKQLILNKIKKQGYKFIPTLNKMKRIYII